MSDNVIAFLGKKTAVDADDIETTLKAAMEHCAEAKTKALAVVTIDPDGDSSVFFRDGPRRPVRPHWCRQHGA